MKRGGCLCGSVTYEVSGDLRPVVACHCAQCRKTSGHHVAATATARADLRINGDVKWYESSERARRGFCGTCGANLFWDGGGDYVSIFAGTLDDTRGLTMAGHIYCEDKGAYYEIMDDLPKADRYDPALTAWPKT